ATTWPFCQRGLDFPPEPERQICGVEEEQQPRGRRGDVVAGHDELLEQAGSVPPAHLVLVRPPPGGRKERLAVRAVDRNARGSPAPGLPPFRRASHSATASTFQSDHGRCWPSRKSRRSSSCCSRIERSASMVMKLKISASDSYSRITRAMKRW